VQEVYESEEEVKPNEYISSVTKYLRDEVLDGRYPEHTEIERELATRCLDLLDRYRELRYRADYLYQQLLRHGG